MWPPAIPRRSPATAPNASSFAAPKGCRKQFLTLCADCDANAQFAQTPAHRISSHAENADDGKYRTHPEVPSARCSSTRTTHCNTRFEPQIRRPQIRSVLGSRLVRKGTVHKGVDVPFEIDGSLSTTEAGDIRIHADRIKSAAHIPVKGLLHRAAMG